MVPRVERLVRIRADLAGASSVAAKHLRDRAVDAVRERGRFSLVLSGGATPIRLFRELAVAHGRGWPWEATEVFFADERCVPLRRPDSNFGAAWTELLSHVPIPRRRIYRIRGELRSPAEGARRYDRLVGRRAERGSAAPLFDLVFLGIGPDGHTASLFPGSPAVRENDRFAVAVPRSPLPPNVPRITLTLRALSSAREACFLVSGAEKSAALGRIFRSGPGGDPRLPASLVRPRGPTVWFLDRTAAARLSSEEARRRAY